MPQIQVKPAAPAMTNKTAGVSVPVMPITRHRRPELEIFDSSITAAPMSDPASNQVTSKNPNIELRWVNHLAGDGLRLRQMQAEGWVVATPTDVECPRIVFHDGAFKSGDRILMKNDRNRVLGAYKHNALRAMQLASKMSVKEAGQQALHSQTAGIGLPAQIKAKMSVFVPLDAEVEGMAGGADGDINQQVVGH